jgi:type I site-specific restriction endonuclease
MNEAETRAEHIDPALAAAGWGVVEGSRIRREYGITLGRLEGAGRRGKPLTADYVLEYRNTKLAVVEAKPWHAELTEGVGQAKNYAGMLAVRFTYSANGQGVYALEPLTREERAAKAMAIVSTQFNERQKVFLDFVLSQYVTVGVEELDQAKLTPLLRLKYHDSIADAVADLGKPEEIGKVFAGFQKYLYQEVAR